MTDEKDAKFDLDAYFKAGREAGAQPSSSLVARIEADIEAVDTDRLSKAAPKIHKPSLVERIMDSIGGWPALSGIATAGVVGVVVGISPPEALSEFTSVLLNGTSDYYLVDPSDGFGFESFEG